MDGEEILVGGVVLVAIMTGGVMAGVDIRRTFAAGYEEAPDDQEALDRELEQRE